MVNLYEIPAARKAGGDEAGRVVRVVKFPVMSYTFDREGRVIEEIVYKDNSDAVSTRTEIQYCEHGPNRKDIFTYTYSDDAVVKDTILAQHRIHRYAYDPEGKMTEYLISETDGKKELKTDSVDLDYYSDGEIQSIDFHHLQRNIVASTEYTHFSINKAVGKKNGGGRTEVERDDKGRFLRVVDYFTDTPDPNMDLAYMYKNDRLDSTYAEYRTPGNESGQINQITNGYYYDRQGKLVMIRTYRSSEMIQEQLFEYFEFEDSE